MWGMFGLAAQAWMIALFEHLDWIKMSISEQLVIAGIAALILFGLVFLDWKKNRVPHKNSVQLT